MWTWWKHISDPALWPNERLFFELYGQALQGRGTPPSSSTGSSRTRWSRPPRSTSPAEFPGSCPGARRAGVAITRGLLLDLLATGDVAGVDDAMDAFIDLYEAGSSARRGRPP